MPLLTTVLHALISLVPKQPTIFRPFLQQINSWIVELRASCSVSSIQELHTQLLLYLNSFVPKGVDETYKDILRGEVSAAHETADVVFRAVIEQWESVDASLRQSATLENGGNEIDGYYDVERAASRLINQLRLLSGRLTNPTASTVSIPFGSVFDLTSRLTSVLVPAEGTDTPFNLQIGREERDVLWDMLPRIHAACIRLFTDIVDCLDISAIPLAHTILEQTHWVFQAEKYDGEVRLLTYSLVHRLVSEIGPSMSKQSISSLCDFLRPCFSDILPPPISELMPTVIETSEGKPKMNPATANADTFLGSDAANSQHTAADPALRRAAFELLTAVLNSVPTEHLPSSIRIEIDRTMILTSDKNGMLASILNPMPIVRGRGSTPSVLPFLARSYADKPDVEALIRPRMPILLNVNGFIDADQAEQQEEEDVHVSSAPYPSNSTPMGLHERLAITFEDQKAESGDPQKGLNKRTHADEQSYPTISLDSSVQQLQRKSDNITKKARLDETVTVGQDWQIAQRAPSDSIVAEASPSPTTKSAILQQEAEESRAYFAGDGSAHLHKEEPRDQKQDVELDTWSSDDEMPTLNIDPDTEDEDENDVNMDG